MNDINKAIVRGRAAADASVKSLPNSTLVTLRIGTDSSYTGRDGRNVERVDWHMIACWGKVAEQAQSVRKGSVVHVEGEIRTRSYDKGVMRVIIPHAECNGQGVEVADLIPEPAEITPAAVPKVYRFKVAPVDPKNWNE